MTPAQPLAQPERDYSDMLLCLETNIRFQAMKEENETRRIKGEPPAYGEDAFNALADTLRDTRRQQPDALAEYELHLKNELEIEQESWTQQTANKITIALSFLRKYRDAIKQEREQHGE